MKKMLLIFAILFFVGPAFSHTWSDSVTYVDSGPGVFLWTIDTLSDSVFWTVTDLWDLPHKTYSGKCPIPILPGTPISLISYMAPIVTDTAELILGYKWVDVLKLEIVGNLAIDFYVTCLIPGKWVTYEFEFPITQTSAVANKIIRRPEIKALGVGGRFLVSGRSIGTQTRRAVFNRIIER
ncbi:MAG TPA: hypothetical protein VKF42_06830 [Chitinivibrionales bacterium]|nr:hypothetical protein [Chitinivibrionales bacterium]